MCEFRNIKQSCIEYWNPQTKNYASVRELPLKQMGFFAVFSPHIQVSTTSDNISKANHSEDSWEAHSLSKYL